MQLQQVGKQHYPMPFASDVHVMREIYVEKIQENLHQVHYEGIVSGRSRLDQWKTKQEE